MKSIRESLDDYEYWINLKWKNMSENLRQMCMETRHDAIAELQAIQLKEFNYE